MVAKFKEPLDVITDHQISPRAQLPQNILNLHSEDHIRTIYPIRDTEYFKSVQEAANLGFIRN